MAIQTNSAACSRRLLIVRMAPPGFPSTLQMQSRATRSRRHRGYPHRGRWPPRKFRIRGGDTIAAMGGLGSRLAAPVRLVAGLLVTGAGLGALVVAEGPGRSTTYAGSSVV